MYTSKEDIKEMLAELSEQENVVVFSDSTNALRFQMQPDKVLYVNTRGGQVESQIRDMCFMMTGGSVLPDAEFSDYLKNQAVNAETIQEHVDDLVSYNVIPEEARVFAYNDLFSVFNGSVGRYAGHLMRHFPAVSETSHPFMVAAVVFKDIPASIVKNCQDIWEHLDKEEQRRFSDSLETYTKFIYCSAVDQLNRTMIDLKNGRISSQIVFNHPGTRKNESFSARMQPILDCVTAYDYLNDAHFWIAPNTKELSLQVKLKPVHITKIYDQVLPMFSFFLVKMAQDTGLTPVALEIISDLVYAEANDNTRALLTVLAEDVSIGVMDIPSFVPKKPLVDFTIDDLKKES